MARKVKKVSVLIREEKKQTDEDLKMKTSHSIGQVLNMGLKGIEYKFKDAQSNRRANSPREPDYSDSDDTVE